MIAKFSKVESNIAKIEKQLETQKIKMLKDITIFDTMYEKNLEYFKDLSLYIIAGERKLEELRNVKLPELQKAAEVSGEQADIQKVNDMVSAINRFEKKIYDLKTTRIISLQMAPQIRLIQNNDSELVEKIQSSLINTIPLWKNQIVIALGVVNAKSALDVQKAVTDTTNEMLQKYNIKETELDGIVDFARNIKGVEIGIFIKEKNEDVYKVSLRANSDLDMSVIAGAFGGGGHKGAAGCKFENKTIEEIKQELLSEINMRLK
jgi:hypothetical protein